MSVRLNQRDRCEGGALLGLSLLVALALSACGGAPSTARVATQLPIATATSTPLPPPAPNPTTPDGHMTILVIQALGTEAKTVTLTFTSSDGDVSVNVTLKWSPDWKTHFDQAQAVAKLACYQAQAALWTSGATLNQVAVVVMGQALDDYSSVITSAYAAAVMSAKSAQGVDWQATSAEQAWKLYTIVFLRPTYAPNWVYLSTSER